MRKLVTVRTVDAIRPIAGADAIDCATVEGWQVVVKKGEFQAGDRCVYFEIDAFLPLTDSRFDFLARNKSTWLGREGVRLRTVKLRGQLSQGLILPLAGFPEIASAVANDADADLTALLGVEKWEATQAAGLSGQPAGAFPAFIRKTDQERIQNLREVLYEQALTEFEVTLKLDGSSMTVFYRQGEAGVCSRNYQVEDYADSRMWQVARQNRLLEALADYGRDLALQGEIIGPGIQGNPEQLSTAEFYLFDVFDIATGSYLGREQRLAVVAELQARGAQVCMTPLLEITTLQRFRADMAAILAYAEGPSLNPATMREGVVFKRLDGQFSFKAISNRYLLKYGDR